VGTPVAFLGSAMPTAQPTPRAPAAETAEEEDEEVEEEAAAASGAGEGTQGGGTIRSAMAGVTSFLGLVPKKEPAPAPIAAGKRVGKVKVRWAHLAPS
jgi:hypothetical protein